MKTRSADYQFGESLPWEAVGPGVKRQIMGYDGQIMAVKVHFDKGGVGVLHEHYQSQVTYVVSGKFEVYIGDKTQVLSAGDGYYIEPDLIHGCKCLEEGILIDMFSPYRHDFMNK